MNYETMLRRRSEVAIKPIIQILNQVHTMSEPDDENFSSIMNAIDEQECLRNYVDSWIDAECNFNTWCQTYPDMSSKVKQYVNGYECHLEAGDNGRGIIYNRPTPKSWSEISSAEIFTFRHFLRIVQSPLFNSLGKCERCSNYFLNIFDHKDKKYCSRACATGHSALKSIRAKRQREQAEKIKRVRKAIEEFKQSKSKSSNWKAWVAKKAGVTQKWITQAYNRGDLPNAKTLVKGK